MTSSAPSARRPRPRTAEGQALVPFPGAPALPPRFGAYLVESVLARGGMGAVLVVRHETLGQRYALKVASDVAVGPETVIRFEREIHALSSLARHPHIVPIHASGVEAGRLYYVMDLIEGVPLDKVLEQGALEPAEAARIGAEVASALGAAHGIGLLHRDVKPGNVLLDRERRAIVFDFGLAYVPGDRLTQTGEILGTPAYMAPEQALGERDRQGPATDVYAVGALVYEAATGHRLFESVRGVAASLTAAIKERPTPPRQHRPEISRELEAVILRCLEKDPARRYPDARALEAVLREIAVAERAGSERAGRARRRARIRTAGWSCLLTVTAAGSFVLERQEGPRRERPALELGALQPTDLAARRAAARARLVERVGKAWKGSLDARAVRELGGLELDVDQLTDAARLLGLPDAPGSEAEQRQARARARLARATLLVDPRARAAEVRRAVAQAPLPLGVPERIFVAETLTDVGEDADAREAARRLLRDGADLTALERLLRGLADRAHPGERARLASAVLERTPDAPGRALDVLGRELVGHLEGDERELRSRGPRGKDDLDATQAVLRALRGGEAAALSTVPGVAPGEGASGISKERAGELVNGAYLLLCRDACEPGSAADEKARASAAASLEAVARALGRAHDWRAKKARAGLVVIAARRGPPAAARALLDQLVQEYPDRENNMDDIDESPRWARLEISLAGGVLPPVEAVEERDAVGAANTTVDAYAKLLYARVRAARALALRQQKDDAGARVQLARALELLDAAVACLAQTDAESARVVEATARKLGAAWREAVERR